MLSLRSSSTGVEEWNLVSNMFIPVFLLPPCPAESLGNTFTPEIKKGGEVPAFETCSHAWASLLTDVSHLSFIN